MQRCRSGRSSFGRCGPHTPYRRAENLKRDSVFDVRVRLIRLTAGPTRHPFARRLSVARRRRGAQGHQHARDPRFHRARVKSLLQGIAGVLAIIGWALGASLVGAEFASRSMTTMLTWETRRIRVITAKAAVVVGAVAVFAALALIAVALALLPAMIFHGAPQRADDPGFGTVAGVIVRGATLAAMAGGMGFAIAALGRNTAAALAAGFAYIIVLENILGNSLRGWRRWLLLGNAIVFVAEHKGVDVPGRSVLGAGLFLAAVTATLLIAATIAFKARDLA